MSPIPENIATAIKGLLAPYGVTLEELTAPQNTVEPVKKKFLTLEEAMSISGLGRWSLWRAAKAGEFRQGKSSPTKKGKILIDRESFEVWLDLKFQNRTPISGSEAQNV